MVQTAQAGLVASSRRQRIYLIGMPGVGKSLVGKLLAYRLGWTYVDTDACVTCMSCMSIPQLFERHGEIEFRKREADCLRRAAMIMESVIATGGGAPVYNNGMEIMLASGLVICLEASIEILALRIRLNTSVRPLFNDSMSALEVELERMQQERSWAYGQADFIVPTEGKVPEQIAREILELTRAGTVFPKTGNGDSR